jgi:hypothetical protein
LQENIPAKSTNRNSILDDFIDINEAFACLRGKIVIFRRSHIAGLIDESKRKIHRQSLMEFIRCGLYYVFPEVTGTMVTGIPTAHSYPFYSKQFKSEMNYVWPGAA